MNKSKYFLLPIIALMSLSSCSNIDEAHSIVAMINYDSYISEKGVSTSYEIDTTQLYDLLDNEISFALEIYQSHCALCQEFEPILDEYISETHIQFYRLGLNTASEISFFEDVLCKDFPEVFEEFNGTPALYIIDRGVLTYSISSNKMTSYTAFSKIADKHFYKKELYSVSSVEGLKKYLEDFDSSLIYMFDYSSIISSEVFTLIHKEMKDGGAPTLIIDINSIKYENLAAICNTLNVGIADHYALYYSGQEVKKNAYLLDDAVSLKEWLVSYLA